MTDIEVRPDGPNIAVRIADKSGRDTELHLTPDDAAALVLALATTATRMDAQSTQEPLHQPPVADALNPVHQLGSDEQGHAVLAVQIYPLPPFRLRFDRDRARALAETLIEIANSPYEGNPGIH